MDRKTLDRFLARIIDRIDVVRIVERVMKCGGKGGPPGPCPENKPGTSNQRSRSGGDKDKDHRRGPGRSRNAEKQHHMRLGDCLGLARSGLDAAVQCGQITPERAAECHALLGDIMADLPQRGVERIHRHVKGFNWFQTEADVDEFDRRTDPRRPAGGVTRGFVRWDEEGPDAGRATVVLDGPDEVVYFHELAHAIDGPPPLPEETGPGRALSNTLEWQEAYHAERGNYGTDGYPGSSAAEWMASLAALAWTAPDAWEEISRRLPLSRAFLEREVLR